MCRLGQQTFTLLALSYSDELKVEMMVENGANGPYALNAPEALVHLVRDHLFNLLADAAL